MTGMLEIAGTLEKLRDELSPKPVGKLLDDQVTAIKETYAELSTSGTGLPGYMIAFVIARLTDGFQLMPTCDGLGDAPTGFVGLLHGQFARPKHESALCRARVCKYASNLVVAVQVKTNKNS